jgi:hypothetical protein
MNDWVASLRGVEKRLAETKGDFALFALFLPSEGSDQWDLIVSAAWARRDDRTVLDLLNREVSATLTENNRFQLARIVIVEPWHVDVQLINKSIQVEHGLVPISNEEHFGYLVERGFVMTSRDYWGYIKRLFPRETDFVFFTRGGDLYARISWFLHDDPSRGHKKSRNIILAISQEALEDYLFIDDPSRYKAEQKLAAFVSERLKRFNPHHDTPEHGTPPREEWRVTTDLFRPAIAVG